jgi:nuclear GTP-binding protein
MQQLAASVAARSVDPEEFEGEDEGLATVGISSSLRAHARSLRAVLSRADVIVEVLDARDPQGTRSRAMERELLALPGDKKLVFVLNKIGVSSQTCTVRLIQPVLPDLVPRENVEAWLTYLRRSFPTLPFKSSTQSQRRNLGSGASAAHPIASVAASTSTQPLLSLLKNYARSPAGGKGKATITIGVVGMPNVGKSSLINTLKRSRACGVAPTPGFTREVQEIALDAGLKVLDCPGVVFEGGDDGPEKALRNALRVEQLQDPIAPVEVLIARCKSAQLMMLYNIPTFTGVQDFLICVARSRGRIKKVRAALGHD